MPYLISFLEGIITFISPCMLPMLPVYLSYFAAGDFGSRAVWKNAAGFVLGFTIVFTCMGAFAGSLGLLLRRYQTIINIISGLIVIFLALSFLGVFKLNIFNPRQITRHKKRGWIFSLLFGMAFSIAWTPCVGAFLGSALLLASQQASLTRGVVMLLCYSVGLGLPFLLSAVLIEKLRGAFAFIKRHYRVINIICGVFLLLVGVMMASGAMGYVLRILS